MKKEPLAKKILAFYNMILLCFITLVVGELLYYFITILMKSSSILGGFFHFCSVLYNYLCIASFFIIQHGWVIYISVLLIILICGVGMRKLPLTEIITFVIVMCLWFAIYVLYNRFVYSTLSYVKVDIDAVKRTVVALNNEPAIVILNLGSVLSSILLIVLGLRSVQRLLTYFCTKKGEEL